MDILNLKSYCIICLMKIEVLIFYKPLRNTFSNIDRCILKVTLAVEMNLN